MKRFLKKVFLLLLIVGGICGSVSLFDHYVIGDQYENNYMAALTDKVERLKSIEGPKIILVGHSNVAFGIDSALLEEKTGMPVVNLGLHGELGNAFHEQIAKLNIGEGDLVIVCHSSFSDADKIYSPILAWVSIGKNVELWEIIRLKDIPTMLSAYPDYIRRDLYLWSTRSGNQDMGTSYSRNAFNKYGDVVYKPEKAQVDADVFFKEYADSIGVPKIGDACVDRLNGYNAYIADRGATLLIAGYPIAYGKYALFDESHFVEFQKKLQDRLDCDIISDYTDYFYPYEYFYDSMHHLTAEGTQVRTEQLISDIERWRAGGALDSAA